jgi:hypothetical protein
MPETPQFKTFEDLLKTLDPADGTKKLEKAMRKEFPQWSWLIKRDNAEWYTPASVIDPAGTVVADDADAWFKKHNQTKVDDLLNLISDLDLRLHRSEGCYLYALGSDAGDQLDFVQARIRVQSEVTCALRGVDRYKLRSMPDHNWHAAERSTALYRCDVADVIRSLRCLERCKATNTVRRKNELDKFKRRVAIQRKGDGGVRLIPFLEMFPELVSSRSRSAIAG